MKNKYFFKSPKVSPSMNTSFEKGLTSPAAPDLHRFGFGSVRNSIKNPISILPTSRTSKPTSFSNHIIQSDIQNLNEIEVFYLLYLLLI